MVRTLARLYGHFAAALGTCILLVLPVAHRLQVPGWAYLYAFPVLAVAYAVFHTLSLDPKAGSGYPPHRLSRHMHFLRLNSGPYEDLSILPGWTTRLFAT